MASNAARVRSAPEPVENRYAPRLPVVIGRATVRPLGEPPVDAVVHDLSVYGCRVVSATDHAEGERLWLRFSGTSPVAATVVWSDGTFTGCRFDEPITNSIFRALTKTGQGPLGDVAVVTG